MAIGERRELMGGYTSREEEAGHAWQRIDSDADTNSDPERPQPRALRPRIRSARTHPDQARTPLFCTPQFPTTRLAAKLNSRRTR